MLQLAKASSVPVVGHDVSARRVRSLEHEVEGLKIALGTRAPIEQAKGALMVRYGIAQDPAFRVLVRWSSVSNVPVRVVSVVVLAVLARHTQSDEPESVVAEDVLRTLKAPTLGADAALRYESVATASSDLLTSRGRPAAPSGEGAPPRAATG